MHPNYLRKLIRFFPYLLIRKFHFPLNQYIDVPLGRIEKAGGKILLSKTSIGENGFIAHFTDTEGNKVSLHSMK